MELIRRVTRSGPASNAAPATGWSLRRYLLALVLAVLLPLLSFAGILLWYEVRRDYAQHRRGLLDTAQALALAVDRERAAAQAVLEALADSPLLDAADWRAFYDHSVATAARYPGAWIVLFAPSGQQVINTLRPFGAALPNTFTESAMYPPAHPGELPLANPELVRRTFLTGEPVHSDLFLGLVAQRPAVSLNVPVQRASRVVYVLSMGLFPEVFARLLREHGIAANAFSTILERWLICQPLSISTPLACSSPTA
jgi:hypothetical protein